MKVLVISGGQIDIEFATDYLAGKHFDRIIAADAGLSWCHKLGLTPTDVLGDFDSLKDRELLESCRKAGVPVRTFPTRKDYTDTHLALMYATDLSADHITILGATGTRYDHALANIGLLEQMADQGISCVIVDAHNQIEMLKGPCQKAYRKDERFPYFSLLAWSEAAEGIDLTGFSYPMSDGRLTRGISLGISNELTGETGDGSPSPSEAKETGDGSLSPSTVLKVAREETGRVKLGKGYLLVIRSCD